MKRIYDINNPEDVKYCIEEMQKMNSAQLDNMERVRDFDERHKRQNAAIAQLSDEDYVILILSYNSSLDLPASTSRHNSINHRLLERDNKTIGDRKKELRSMLDEILNTPTVFIGEGGEGIDKVRAKGVNNYEFGI